MTDRRHQKGSDNQLDAGTAKRGHSGATDADPVSNGPALSDLAQQMRAFANATLSHRNNSDVVALGDEVFGDAGLGRLASLRIPARLGGMGESNSARVAALAAVAGVSPVVAAIIQAAVLGAAPLVYCGSEEQQQRWLPGWVSGRVWPSLAVTEPGSGGNVLAMETRARRTRQGWVISGRKCWVGNSHIAHAHVVVARTGPGPGGLSAFVVEADRPGVSLGGAGGLTGLAGFSCGEVIFDRCRVPAENLVGEVGDGLAAAYATSVLDGRLNIAAVAMGVAEAASSEATAYAAARRIGGKPLTGLATTMARLGRIRSAALTARAVTESAAIDLDLGRACDPMLVNAKYVAAGAAHAAASEAVQVCGARGCAAGSRAQGLLADAQPLLFAAGTADVQERRLGEAAMGVRAEQQWSQRMASRLRAISGRPAAPPPRAGGEETGPDRSVPGLVEATEKEIG